jgi:hypothetical protein
MRKCHKYLLVAVVLLTLLIVTVIMGCGMEELYSTWRDRRVTVDGISDDGEWTKARHYVYMTDGGFTVGIMNDEKMLYLRLSTRNRTLQRKIMTAGLFVWLNETGNRRLSYGIHFPLPSRDEEFGLEKHPNVPGRDGMDRMKSSDSPDLPIEISQGNIEIIGPGDNSRSVIVAGYTSQDGFRCGIGKTRDALIYELQVPLIKNEKCPHGIAVNKPKIIGIGLVTGEDERPRQNSGDRGRDPGGSGGRGPDRGSSRSGPPPQGQPDMAGPQDKDQSIDSWFKVHLAERS